MSRCSGQTCSPRDSASAMAARWACMCRWPSPPYGEFAGCRTGHRCVRGDCGAQGSALARVESSRGRPVPVGDADQEVGGPAALVEFAGEREAAP